MFQAFERVCCICRHRKTFSLLCLRSLVLQTRGDISPLSSFLLSFHRYDRLLLCRQRREVELKFFGLCPGSGDLCAVGEVCFLVGTTI